MYVCTSRYPSIALIVLDSVINEIGSHYFQASSNRSSLNEKYVLINFGTKQEENTEGISQHGIKLIEKTSMTSKLVSI